MTGREYRVKKAILQHKIETNKKLKCLHNVRHYTRELEKLEKAYSETTYDFTKSELD